MTDAEHMIEKLPEPFIVLQTMFIYKKKKKGVLFQAVRAR